MYYDVARIVTWCAIVGLVGMLIMFRGFYVWLNPKIDTGWRIHLVPAGAGLTFVSAGIAVIEAWHVALVGTP